MIQTFAFHTLKWKKFVVYFNSLATVATLSHNNCLYHLLSSGTFYPGHGLIWDVLQTTLHHVQSEKPASLRLEFCRNLSRDVGSSTCTRERIDYSVRFPGVHACVEKYNAFALQKKFHSWMRGTWQKPREALRCPCLPPARKRSSKLKTYTGPIYIGSQGKARPGRPAWEPDPPERG